MFQGSTVQEIAARIAPPLGDLLAPESPYFWLYIASAVAVALGVSARRSGLGGLAALRAACATVFDREVFLHRSAIADYQYLFVNHLIALAAMGVGVASTQFVAEGGAAALTRVFGASPALAPGVLASMLATLAMFLAFDFANFYFHRLQHDIRPLWELHKVHHSAEVLTPLTALRVHPIAAFLGSQFIALCMGLAAAPFLYLHDTYVAEVTVLGVNAGIFLWHTLLANHLAHMHVWVMFPRGVREIFYSPALHLIHHSADPRHIGKNLGFCFTIWDRWFGTLYQPADEERHGLVLGVSPRDMAELRTPWQLYWTPVRNILRPILPRPKPQPAVTPRS